MRNLQFIRGPIDGLRESPDARHGVIRRDFQTDPNGVWRCVIQMRDSSTNYLYRAWPTPSGRKYVLELCWRPETQECEGH